MDLQSPWTLAAAWILGPLLTAAAAAGFGAGLARFGGVRLGALTLPLGYLAGVVAMNGLLRVGLDGWLAAAIAGLAALAAAIPALRELVRDRGRSVWATRTRWLPPALAALAAFALAMAPVAGSGRSGVAGYVLNNDPAIHSTLVEYIGDHGLDTGEPEFASSYTQVSGLADTGYPLGSHVWPLFSSRFAGVDALHMWASSIAVAAAMLALLAFAALRRLGPGPWPAAAGAALVPAGFLFFSYITQGSAKEILTAVAVYGAIVVGVEVLRDNHGWRALALLLIAPAAALFAFGGGAGAWLALPAAVLVAFAALRLRRFQPTRRATALAAAVTGLTVAAAVPLVREALDYVDNADASLRDPAQVGNLLGPVPVKEALNLWFAYDYRVQPPIWETLSSIGPWVAGALAALGLLFALLRRELAVPLMVGSGVLAAVIVSSRYSIYLDAKSYAILAPALGMATAAGVLALLRGQRAVRAVGFGVGVVVGAGVLAGGALVYAGAWITPKDRFEELQDIADRFRGEGPILINEREEWTYYVLRDLQPIESWGAWQPSRGFNYGPVPLGLPHTPDFDDYTLDHINQFELLLDRKRPGGSRPPANYQLAFETPDYAVWRRTGPAVAEHLPLGQGTLDNTGRLECDRDPAKGLIARARSTRTPLVISIPDDPPRLVADADQWRAYETRPEPAPRRGRNRPAASTRFGSREASVPE